MTSAQQTRMRGSPPLTSGRREPPRAQVADLFEGWRSLADRAIYFGHQSVGDDIMRGVERLNKDVSLNLRLVQTRVPAAVSHPAFVHFHAGSNQDRVSKNTDFLRILDARPRADNPIAILKYCYVDVVDGTDVDAAFAAYRQTVSQVRERHPDVVVVHTTVPLTTVEGKLKAAAKGILGRRAARDDAKARHRYNSLVRAAFKRREPLFDIARVESLRTDASRALFSLEGEEIEVMADGNTRDGGHLNERGQRALAAELLDVLSKSVENAR
jgi:lysophospholipase L1-like esterase